GGGYRQLWELQDAADIFREHLLGTADALLIQLTDAGEQVECRLLVEGALFRRLAVEQATGLQCQCLHFIAADRRHGLVGGDGDRLQAGFGHQRLQRHQRLYYLGIGAGYDATTGARILQRLRVDLSDHQRHIGVAPESTAGIHHQATGGHGPGCPAGRHFRIDEQHHGHPREVEPLQHLDPLTLTPEHGPAAGTILEVQQVDLAEGKLMLIQHVQQGLTCQAAHTYYRNITGLAHMKKFSLNPENTKGTPDQRGCPDYLRCSAAQPSSRIRSMRRSGSAAPHSNWSPTVKADRYCEPMLSLRRRPTGTFRVPVTAVGVRSRTLASFSLGTTLDQGLCASSMASISASGTSLFSLMVSAWLWQRMAPIRTQIPSTGIGRPLRPMILLVSAWAFHSSRLWPLGSCLSIHGIRLPASGTPKLSAGKLSSRRVAAT